MEIDTSFRRSEHTSGDVTLELLVNGIAVGSFPLPGTSTTDGGTEGAAAAATGWGGGGRLAPKRSIERVRVECDGGVPVVLKQGQGVELAIRALQAIQPGNGNYRFVSGGASKVELRLSSALGDGRGGTTKAGVEPDEYTPAMLNIFGEESSFTPTAVDRPASFRSES